MFNNVYHRRRNIASERYRVGKEKKLKNSEFMFSQDSYLKCIFFGCCLGYH